MAVPQIVIDTNVLIAGMRSRRGASAQILRLVGTDQFEIHLSVPLVFEYEEILKRELARDVFSTGELDDFINYLCAVGIPHEIRYLWRPTLPDPDDEFVLELALAANVDYIVTYNLRDLAYASEFGIKVINPAQFLELLRRNNE